MHEDVDNPTSTEQTHVTFISSPITNKAKQTLHLTFISCRQFPNQRVRLDYFE